MLIFSEVSPYINKEINKLNKYIDTFNDIKAIFGIHGTFSHGFKKNLRYISDVDGECWIKYENNIESIYKFIYNFLLFLINNNYYLNTFLIGYDNRFEFGFRVKKDGKVINYNYDDIKKKIIKLHKDKIINKDEKDKLIFLLKKNPNLIEIEKFKVELEEFQSLNWSIDEIKNNFKIQRKRKFSIFEELLRRVTMTSFVFEFKEGSYITFEINIHLYKMMDNYNYKNIEDIIKYATLLGEYDRKTNIFYYEGIFKNYVKEKYLKVLKRIRSLLSTFLEYKNNKINSVNMKKNSINNTFEKIRDIKYYNFIRKTRHEIKNYMLSDKISCLNQIKSSIENIIILINYKDNLEIKRLTINLLKDIMYVCKYSSLDIKNIYEVLEEENFNKNKLKDVLKIFNKNLFSYLNNLVLPVLIIYYDKLKDLLPFTLILPLPKNNKK